MKIYYAHSKKIYNTRKEEAEYAKIRKQFPDARIVCPNRDLGELGSMESYLRVVGTCDAVVCSEYKRLIGKGALTEVLFAISSGKPAYNLSKKFKNVKSFELVNQGRDWVGYAKLIHQ